MVIDFKKITWLPFLLIIVLTIHMCLSLADMEVAVISYGVQGLFLLSFFFMLFIYLRQGEMSLFVILCVIYQFFLLSVTIVNNTDIKNCFYFACEAIFIVTIIEYYKERLSMVLFAFAIGFSICVYIALFQILTNPILWNIDHAQSAGGYLLGNNYNQMGCRLICAVVTNMVCARIKKWYYLNAIPVVLASVILLGIVQSMTSLTCILLFAVFTLIPYKKLQKIGIIALLIFVLLFQFLVCFNGKGIENNEYAVYFIEDVLKKDITFTNRTEMWDAAGKTFSESPIWGHGYVDGEWYLTHMSSRATGPHNQLYSVLIYGGILLFFQFIVISLMSLMKIVTETDKTSNTIFAAIACFMLMATMEAFPFAFTLFLLSLAYYSPFIKNDY